MKSTLTKLDTPAREEDAMAVRLNLKRDLPKALAMREQLLENVGICLYAAPCVVGAMVNPRKRKALDNTDDGDDTGIVRLIEGGHVCVPADQIDDLERLQSLFDFRDAEGLNKALDEMAAKYLPEQVSA